MPTRDAVNRILSVTDDTLTGSQETEIVGAGFSGRRGTLTRALVVARMDEYAVAYLLDRQEAPGPISIYADRRRKIVLL